MSAQSLIDTARTLVADDKGLLAMDESNGTCNKRFAAAGIPQTLEARRAYRELIVTTPGLGECISGVILYDETIRQQKKDGTSFVKILADAGVIPGIKVDIGAKDLAGHPGEKVTEGLDGLRDRLQEYLRMGARFAKWRAVITLGEGIPSRGCIEANAQALARYAALCQEVGLVPVVEPEVLMDGDHTLERCRAVTEEVLRAVFDQLSMQKVMLEGMILKPNMVLPGLNCAKQETVDEVADVTVKCLLRVVPAAVPGIAFLSGGQSGELASARLNAMNARSRRWDRDRRGLWRFRSPAPSSSRPWRYGRASRQMLRRPKRLSFIEPAATGLRAAASTAPRWKREPDDRHPQREGAQRHGASKMIRAQSDPLRLYFIRHGGTAWSLSGQHTGRTDIPLTVEGEDQARELGPWLATIQFTHVLTSPRLRARRTCELAGLSAVAEIEPDLSEWDYGDYEGRRSEDICERRPGWNMFRDGCPGGKSPAQISDRADRLIARLRTLEGNIALFSHGEFGRVLAVRWIGAPVLEGQNFAFGTASLSILGYEPPHPETPVIALWNAAPGSLPNR